jgi:hypothetical protein
MKRIFQLVMIFLTVSGLLSVNAQVHIGSDADPHRGSILDLSNADNLGLLLPRISLDAAGAWTCNGGQIIGGNETQATGMVVFNTNATMANGYGAGVYVWDGAKWNIAGQGTANPFVPGDYGTPDATHNPVIGGISYIDVRAGQPDSGTQQYVVTETGTGTITNVIWSVTPSTQGLLTSNSASGAGNTTQSLVFKSQAELLTVAENTDQTIVLVAYIEYSDGIKVQVSTIIKIQNRAYCQGVIIPGGTFTGSATTSVMLVFI